MAWKSCIGNANLEEVLQATVEHFKIPKGDQALVKCYLICVMMGEDACGVGANGKWTVDVASVAKRATRQGHWCEPTAVMRYCEAVVLEEVCHAMGYEHESTSPERNLWDTLGFMMLVGEYIEDFD